jgi:hypothetical protein
LQFVPDGPEAVILSSDDEEIGDMTETEDGVDGESTTDTGTEGMEESDNEEGDDGNNIDESEEEWVPPTPAKGRRASKAKVPMKQKAMSSASCESDEDPTRTVKQPARKMSHRVSKLANNMSGLALGDFNAPDDSVVILPVKKFRANQASVIDSDDEISTRKKRKR